MKKRFDELGLSAELLNAVADMGFEEATAVQSESIPVMMQGGDMVAQAPTGTGKTCAFGIPIVEQIDPNVNCVQALVLCPTRELAVQSATELTKLAKYKKGIRVLPIYGGQQIQRQIFALKNKPQILIATPGRLMDHMERHTVRLDYLKTLVLDEADEMLNMGFRDDIDEILKTVPENKQTILFSATLSPEIMEITKNYQKDAQVIKVAPKEVTVPTITQYYVEVKSPKKLETLCRLLEINEFRQVMVFCNTKRMVEDLCEGLNLRGFRADGLHGDMKQAQRDKVMAAFKSNRTEMLIATDVAARGIDVEDISCVINYDLPSDEEYYVHRIGRTGRANRKGVAYSFVNPKDMYRLRQIMNYTKTPIKLIKAPSQIEVEDAKTLRWFSEISGVIASGAHLRYTGMIQQYLENAAEDVTVLDVASALLCRMAEQKTRAVAKPVTDKSESHGFQSESRSRGRRDDAPAVNAGWEEEFKPFGKPQKNKKVATYPTFDQTFDADIFAQADEAERKAAEKRQAKEGREFQKDTRNARTADGTTRLFLNIGRMDHINKKELSEFLSEALEIPERDISSVEVLDKFSFVNLPQGIVEDAIEILKGVEIDDRKLSVEIAGDKGNAPKKERSFGGDKKGRSGDFGGYGEKKNFRGNDFGGDKRGRGGNFGDKKNNRSSFEGDKRAPRGNFDGDKKNVRNTFDGDKKNTRSSFEGDKRTPRGNFDGDKRAPRGNFDGKKNDRNSRSEGNKSYISRKPR